MKTLGESSLKQDFDLIHKEIAASSTKDSVNSHPESFTPSLKESKQVEIPKVSQKE